MTMRAASRDLLRALAVLALVCLNYAHAPVAVASPHGTWTAIDAGTYCGDPLDGDPAQHAPCHACRIGSGADLPPPCPAVAPAPVSASLVYSAPAAARLPGRATPSFLARGPPAA